MNNRFRGYFDSFAGGTARGWVFDQTNPHLPVNLHVVVDRQEVGTVACNGFRGDVLQSRLHPTGAIGFEFAVPQRFADGQPHDISFRLPTREALGFVDPVAPGMPSDRVSFTLPPYAIRGFVDGLHHDRLRGWAIRQFYGGRSEGGCQVRVTANGREVATVRADRHRRDVAEVMGCDPGCGFEVAVPASFSRARSHTFRFHVVPGGGELENSPLTTTLTTDQLVERLAEASDRMTELFREFTSLRRLVDELLPRAGHSLDDYGAWAASYYPALRRRVKATRNTASPTPLVSVIIPAYRPLISDFTAAVESVLGQSYPHWELVIVDDASRSVELTELIAGFCARDPRIRSVPRRRNGGISAATNTAIAAAQGEWVALFDHDDVLVDVALEVMVRAALRTGADYLYSDEDKIDQAGHFLEPNLKPDWDHRYMLGCNYACHLSLVRRSCLAAVGPLRSEYDGAQDHDLILRLSEVIPPERIHHVPEILYHWRMTPNSTAVSVNNKGYAQTAGVRAVQAHLDRIGRKGTVSAIQDVTIYRVDWHPDWHPAVTVIVPFREQVEMTRRCLRHLLDNTGCDRLNILLVDNWSTSAEAAAFVGEAVQHPGVRVLRVEEPFNFSRLNNLAAAATEAEVICLLNNDMLVDEGWLHAALGELADEDVGAVGGRFRYPDGKLQHAGVAVGLPDFATHTHVGADETEYGYIGQIALSREVTAVTGAGLLVRHAVYDAVGGMDEQGLPVAYNDVDLCLKIREAGYKVVYCADWRAEHHESLSRGSDDRPEHERRFFHEREHLRERWAGHAIFDRDPAYSRFFTVGGRTCHDLRPPEPG